ncbi:hypothetical protein BDZ91DRAFT_25165 [Kalaharituber pfeilii]|nr:hypothetical protein BDZ91DRAFT_25165 [Kalaharituber pfeilii]
MVETVPPPSRPYSRRPSLTLSQLEIPNTPSHSATLEQIHASSSTATGLTSFDLGSPPPSTTEPLTFNKLYSKVKSVAAGVREAVREAVVVGPHSRFKVGINDSKESFDDFSVGASSERASPTISNFYFRSRHNNPHRLSFSNASIVSKGSTGSNSGVGGDVSPLVPRRTSMLSPGPKSLPSPSLANVTVFRDGTKSVEPSNVEGNLTGGTRTTTTRGAMGTFVSGNSTTNNSTPPPNPEEITLSNRYSALQNRVDANGEDTEASKDVPGAKGGSANPFEEDVVLLNTDSALDGTPLNNAESKTGFADQGHNVGLANINLHSASSSPTNQAALGSSTSLPAVVPQSKPGNSLANGAKRKESVGGLSESKSLRKRPKAIKRTSENLLPGFTYNSESDTEDEQDIAGSPADATSFGLKAAMQRKGTDMQPHRPAFSALSGVGGVRAIAGWFGVGASIPESQNTDRSVNGSGGAAVAGSGGNIEARELALQQLRKGNLTREFWMKDENCKDCFLCGKTFNAFRRKHHCRLCGQIFCSKCTSTISGERFGYNGSMKVCLECLEIVKEYKDESDLEQSNSQTLSIPEDITSHTAGNVPSADSAINPEFNMLTAHRPATTRLMAIPATRTTAGSNPNRRSAILEINSDIPSPPRPTSSRSMKAQTVSSRPMTAASYKHSYQHNHQHPYHSHYHKHTHSRSLHRWPGNNPNERAPFHRNPAEDVLDSMKTLPAFHSDSIIDPELAPYMSDQDATDDEQISIFATIAPRHPDGHATGQAVGQSHTASVPLSQGDKGPNNGASSASAVGTPGKPGKAMSLRNVAAGIGLSSVVSESGNSNKHHQIIKPTKRNSNFLNPLQPRAGVRGKSHRGIMRQITSASDSIGSRSNIASGSRVARSSSTRGPLASSIELNTASLQHVQNLLKQLLRDAGIQEVDKWEQALMPILLKSTDDLNPDVRAGDEIDIRHYIKVKRIPGGKEKDTSYVSGVVFTKNLALKSMPRSITQPRIVIITFPIEYQRSQQFMSLEPVIAQEKEFLQNMVNRIVALKPTLLLVGENVSGLALQYLSAANIATAYHVKSSVIEAVSRCAQADVFSSVDKLALSHFRIGRCARFDVKTFVHDNIPNRKKTFMFLSGCAKELGCTIVLRGADMDTLAIIKQITEMMVYVVYNLKLETCLMRDEFVLIPSSPMNTAPSPGQPSTSQSAPPTEDGLAPSMEAANDPLDHEKTAVVKKVEDGSIRIADGQVPDGIPTPSYYEDMVKKHETKILSASPFVKYTQPYLLMTARELERKLVYLRWLRDRQIVDEKQNSAETIDPEKAALYSDEEKPEKFELIRPEMVHGDGQASKGAKEILRAIHDVEYEKAYHVYTTQKKQWENYLAQYDDLFDPYAHQNICVLYTMVCTVTSVPCEGPEIRRLVFYDQGDDWQAGKSDCTLGQYVEHLCDTAHRTCSAPTCDKRMFDHHRSYVHGQARVSVLVSDKVACPNQGMKNTILMWSYCKICPNTNTPPIPMSESTWKYSFAKYLELSFWSSELKLRGGKCPHDLSRDHVRCFGYKGITVVFQHDPIELLEIFVPRTRITYKPELDLKVKNDQYIMYEEKINRFMGSVRARLNSIKVETVAPEKHEACRAEIERLLGKLDDEQAWLIAKLQEKYTKSKYYEIIPMNRAMRAMQEKILDWDMEFSAFDNNFFPSEKDIRRLAALQLRKIFLEPAPHTSAHEETALPEKGEVTKPPLIDGTSTPLEPTAAPIYLSSQATQDALASVMDENVHTEEVQEKDVATTVKEPDTLGTVLEAIPEPAEGDGSIMDTPVEPDQEAPPTEPTGGDQPVMDLSAAVPIPAENFGLLQEQNISPASSSSADSKQRSTSLAHPSLHEIPKGGEGKVVMTPSPTPPSSTGSTPRRKGIPAPPFSRTHSVPSVLQTRKMSDGGSQILSHPRKSSDGGLSSGSTRPPYVAPTPNKKASEMGKHPVKNLDKPKTEKKLMDRLRLNPHSTKKAREKDPIPRSVPNKLQRRDTKVYNLTKQFEQLEQLSREFEKERARERKQRRTKVYPVAPTKPIVEIYTSVKEAVEAGNENTVEDEYPAPTDSAPPPLAQEPLDLAESTDDILKTESSVVLSPKETVPPPPEAHEEEPAPPVSQPHTDDESDADLSTVSDHEGSALPSIAGVLPPTPGVALDSELKELPKHERSSLMNILSKFWAERSASGWTSLDYPLAPTEHIFADSDVIVREDEPSSLIAFTLKSPDYITRLENIRNESNSASLDNSTNQSQSDMEGYGDLERSLLKTTGTHLKYQFGEGSAKMYCKIFYAEQFDALRKNCGVEDRFAESLSRCTKWDSKGGKSKSVFLKTLDDRIVMKALQTVETAAFLKFAPAYFSFMSEAFFHELPTVIAKMLGFYQIFIKNPVTGTEIKWDVLVMENLFYDRKTTRIFDLKGSMRNRYAQSTGHSGEVLLDENMVEFIYESPLFVREHAKKLLRASLWNDTLFLSKQNVMDYSLMIGIDEVKKELVVGIIDCIRTYTWDKKLESWVKDLTGGGRNLKPTVTSPKEYKHRFREAMERYILEAPSCWQLFRMSWMSPVQVRLAPNNAQSKETNPANNEYQNDNYTSASYGPPATASANHVPLGQPERTNIDKNNATQRSILTETREHYD